MKKEPIPLSILCATDAELVRMYDRPSYTAYYKAMIRDEMNKRGIELMDQPLILPAYATQWV